MQPSDHIVINIATPIGIIYLNAEVYESELGPLYITTVTLNGTVMAKSRDGTTEYLDAILEDIVAAAASYQSMY